jgi:XTP/dITP diphosphohydrolase
VTAQRLLLATRNRGKVVEFRRILNSIAPGEIDLVGLDQFPDVEEVEETGKTFEENALLKAREMSLATGLPAIADDSGLCIDALGGDPGIYSARWAGSHGDDAANIVKVLSSMIDIPEENRGAHFTCVAALVLPDGRSHVEEAHFDGFILGEPIGSMGFGYDPIFRPDGFEISSAQMSPEVKDSVSHRGKSLRAIAPHVITLLKSLG